MLFISLLSSIELNDTMQYSLLEDDISNMTNGDKAALAHIYEQTKTAVYGFALSILKNPQDAEDVLQETYIHIFHGAASYKPCGKPMAWIFTITRNLALMRLRQRKHIVDLDDDDWTRYYQSNEDICSDDKIVIQIAMKHLGDQERQIVMLHAMSGFKHREISQLLEIPLSTVLSKYYRAIKKLRVRLQEGNVK